jgi:predicted transcriptional regulator
VKIFCFFKKLNCYLNATIERIKETKAKYDAVVKEAKQVSESIHSQADALKQKNTEKAGTLENVVYKAIKEVQKNSSKAVENKTQLIQAINQSNSVEQGKGATVNSQA